MELTGVLGIDARMEMFCYFEFSGFCLFDFNEEKQESELFYFWLF